LRFDSLSDVRMLEWTGSGTRRWASNTFRWFSEFRCFLRVCVGVSGKARFAFVVNPIALAFDVDDGGAIQETVESVRWP
jgi:hypothetical protein